VPRDYRLCSNTPLGCTCKDSLVGECFAGLLVNDVLLVELKTVKALGDAHRMQCTNYLKAAGLQLCLLFNFGKSRLEIKRVVHGL
jgi:GxxExxY protein